MQTIDDLFDSYPQYIKRKGGTGSPGTIAVCKIAAPGEMLSVRGLWREKNDHVEMYAVDNSFAPSRLGDPAGINPGPEPATEEEFERAVEAVMQREFLSLEYFGW